jgi:hypothetical protein
MILARRYLKQIVLHLELLHSLQHQPGQLMQRFAATENSSFSARRKKVKSGPDKMYEKQKC